MGFSSLFHVKNTVISESQSVCGGDTKALLTCLNQSRTDWLLVPHTGGAVFRLLSISHESLLVCTPVSEQNASSPHSPPGPFPPTRVFLGPVSRVSPALSSFPALCRPLGLTCACWRAGQARTAEPDSSC